MKRLITYDIIKGNDYSKLYEFIEKYKGIQITESTYEITCSLSLDVFKQEIRKVIRSNDKVYVISVNTDNVLFYTKV
ncbi:MAG: hypothetical protein WDA47_09235 [Bacilli bacterium]|jgi:CRISPR/Cas system-associated endoribonuclease Cas2